MGRWRASAIGLRRRVGAFPWATLRERGCSSVCSRVDSQSKTHRSQSGVEPEWRPSRRYRRHTSSPAASFYASDHDLGLILEPDAAGNPIARWFVPRIHNGVNVIVLDFQAMTTELVTFSSWMMNTIRPVVRADFTLPEIPEARLLLGDAMKNLHRFLAGLRVHAGLVFPWDPGFRGDA